MEDLTELRLATEDFETVARQSFGAGAVVGRRSEKRVLYEWIERTREGKGAVLFLTGPSGSGKTRLARIAASHARRRNFGVYTGMCGVQRGPYAPFVEALQGALTGALPPPVREPLETCLKEQPALAELIRWGVSAGDDLNEEPIGAYALFQTLALALIVLAGSGPALLIVEDLHLADRATLEFLQYLAVRVRTHRLLTLVTCRTDERGDPPERQKALVEELCQRYGAGHVGFGGLNAQETDDLIRSVYKKNLFSNDLRRGIQRATGGNPSSVLEALRLFREQGMIYEEDGIWRECRGSAPAVETLPDLYETVARRLEQFPPDRVRLLRLAAVSGSRFDPAVIEGAMGLGHLPFLRVLSHLRRAHGVVAPDGAHFIFTSDRLRETILQRIPPDLLPRLHLALAEGIEQAFPDRREEMVEALAEHYFRGGDISRALPCLIAAGDRARRFSACDRAAACYEQALSALEKGEVEGQQLLLLRKAAGAYIQMKRWNEAEAHLQALLNHARRLSDGRAEAEAWKGIGSIYAKRKDFGLALALYRRSLERFREEGDAAGACDTLVKIGSVHLEQGKWRDLYAVYDRALRLARKLGSEDQVASISMNMAIMFNIRGDASRAMQAYRQSLDIYRRRGLWDKVTAALLNIGKCFADRAEYGQARRHYAACLEMAQRRHDLLHCAIAQLNLSEVLLAEGDLEGCQTVCEAAWKRFEEIDHRMGIADAYRIVGCLHARRNERPPAVACFERSVALNREVGYPLGEAEACRDYGRFLKDAESPEKSGEMCQRARAIFLGLGSLKEVEQIDRLMAETPSTP